jgi:hypothetical protein
MEMFLSTFTFRARGLFGSASSREREAKTVRCLFIVPETTPENKQSGDFLMIVTDSPPDASK